MRCYVQYCSCCKRDRESPKWLDKVRRLRKEPLPDVSPHESEPDPGYAYIVDSFDLDNDWTYATEIVPLPPRTLEQRLQEIRRICDALPVDENDERVIDALIAKRAANIKTRPLKTPL